MGWWYIFGASIFTVSFVWAILNYITGSGLFAFSGIVGCVVSYFLMDWSAKGVVLK